jgi:hypothetical protein
MAHARRDETSPATLASSIAHATGSRPLAMRAKDRSRLGVFGHGGSWWCNIEQRARGKGDDDLVIARQGVGPPWRATRALKRNATCSPCFTKGSLLPRISSCLILIRRGLQQAVERRWGLFITLFVPACCIHGTTSYPPAENKGLDPHWLSLPVQSTSSGPTAQYKLKNNGGLQKPAGASIYPLREL